NKKAREDSRAFVLRRWLGLRIFAPTFRSPRRAKMWGMAYCGPATQLFLRSCSRRRRRGHDKTSERIAIEGVGLPGCLVPHPIHVTEHLDGDDDPSRAELVLAGDTVVDQFAFRVDFEAGDAHQLALVQELDVVVAGVLF